MKLIFQVNLLSNSLHRIIVLGAFIKDELRNVFMISLDFLVG